MWVELVRVILLPILIALASYAMVDRLGEWKKRRQFSLLGVAIIDTLLEEVLAGTKQMNLAFKATQTLGEPVPNRLPTSSWNGMHTIPDEVLLRIIAASDSASTIGLHPRSIRTHCKNYFAQICTTYNSVLESPDASGHWRTGLVHLLSDLPQGGYISAANEVVAMLEATKSLLSKNAKRWLPK